ncbi:lipoprotein-anchoring transpeptidase ErfK/SrfK [Rhizobium leguminosarum]|uniref:Lipoprotein-anchoring transpeptidase ErfK/SrfK n=2 Tax=Rhizobium/Agrobacterium group TaxID=227290 RepID=A0AAE2MJV5_RHILE|nr:lipoprotein-anchoring transpeptidase ErfK/SrfK [Rhizobium leguminosarum]MBB4431924.1 lipoprotein-anchoring transpeptidase ErfK/SrfK [Rhizobium esperanzae]MBB4297464.1 lipoprotein-anchoring transpeptidase ErfK/SrfK [Rhizobium leguminosarum]MBB4307336.1 lipoprotein-anchoring transpeptidase ErfK/SrfK [Rhizobium leguminosarum]MBB4415109.1 lipoprotein-anchoring transpeptidase ErfK/SrfK [Rhizobium leguminosarum]
MKTPLPMSLLALAISVGGAAARELRSEAINGASIAALGAEMPSSTDPDPAIVRLQVLLDRAGASPGVIDGLSGENVNKAVAGFEAMNKLPVDGRVDPEVVSRLEGNAPIVESYVVSAEDAKGLVDRIPEDYGEKAKMQSLGYTSVAEKLSERFHMGIDLVNALNPASQFAPGDTVWVVNPGVPREGKVKRIEADKQMGQVLAYADNGSLLAVYPATIGSEDNPAPSGKHKVKGVARMPVYRYDPKRNFKQGKNNKVLTIPKGPNGPVGTVWIDLTEPTYGIHGTPEPKFIDKVGSHGCVRLTNWDAEELAGMVKPGVLVDFVNRSAATPK